MCYLMADLETIRAFTVWIPNDLLLARQRVGPISLGIAPRACTILSKLLLLLLLLLLARQRAGPTSLGIAPPRVYDSE